MPTPKDCSGRLFHQVFGRLGWQRYHVGEQVESPAEQVSSWALFLACFFLSFFDKVVNVYLTFTLLFS